MAQVFSCEFCEISKNTFFQKTPPVAASELSESSKNALIQIVPMLFSFIAFLQVQKDTGKY